jgi:hypothetical protein
MMEWEICKMAKEHYVMKMARCKMAMGSCRTTKVCCKMVKADCKMEQAGFHTSLLVCKMMLVSLLASCMMVLGHCKMASFLVFCTKELVHYMMVDCKRVKNHRNCCLNHLKNEKDAISLTAIMN